MGNQQLLWATFQCLATLLIKNFFFISNLSLPSFIFKISPLSSDHLRSSPLDSLQQIHVLLVFVCSRTEHSTPGGVHPSNPFLFSKESFNVVLYIVTDIALYKSREIMSVVVLSTKALSQSQKTTKIFKHDLPLVKPFCLCPTTSLFSCALIKFPGISGP